MNSSIKPTTTLADGTELYQIKYAAQYVERTTTALRSRVERWNKEHPNDKINKLDDPGGHKSYYKKIDLDRLFALQISE